MARLLSRKPWLRSGQTVPLYCPLTSERKVFVQDLYTDFLPFKVCFQAINNANFMAAAQQFAERTVKKQMTAFRSWGVMADWDKSVYYTYDKEYEVAQLEAFFTLYTKVHP